MANVKPSTKAAAKKPATKPASKPAAKAPSKVAPAKEVENEVVENQVEEENAEAEVNETPAPKKTPKNAPKAAAVEAEPVRDIDPEEDEEGSQLLSSFELETYTVRIDNKKYENRTAEQVTSLVFGVLGSASKITIEQ